MKLPKDEFIKHSCEQVLRFTQVSKWDDLSEERKVQLGFNLGVLALGLGLTKEEGFLALTNARNGTITMKAFHEHLRALVVTNKIKVDEEKIKLPF